MYSKGDPMRVDLLFPDRFIKAADLQGHDVTVQIERVTMEDLVMTNGHKERKPVVRFVGKDKAMVLNKTNAYLIAESHGLEMDRWQGCKIVLYPTRVKYGKEMVPAVRVRGKRPYDEGMEYSDEPV